MPKPAPTPAELTRKILGSVDQLSRSGDKRKQEHWKNHLWSDRTGWKALAKESVDTNDRQSIMHGQSPQVAQQVLKLLTESDFEARAKAQFVNPAAAQKHAVFILQQLGGFKSWPQALQTHYEQVMRANKEEGWKTLVKETVSGQSSPTIDRQMSTASQPLKTEVLALLMASDFGSRVKDQMPQLHFQHKVGALGGGNDVASGDFVSTPAPLLLEIPRSILRVCPVTADLGRGVRALLVAAERHRVYVPRSADTGRNIHLLLQGAMIRPALQSSSRFIDREVKLA